MFKSAEEREAERTAREEEQAREEAARAEKARTAEEQGKRQAFLASPIGAATAAKEQGQIFFEVQLEVGGHVGSAGFGSIASRRTTASSAAVLGQIEKLGWRLEHAGYFFMITGESSTDRPRRPGPPDLATAGRRRRLSGTARSRASLAWPRPRRSRTRAWC